MKERNRKRKLFKKPGHIDAIMTWKFRPNVDGQYDEYVKHVKVKQMDDISAEVEDEKNIDVICRLVS